MAIFMELKVHFTQEELKDQGVILAAKETDLSKKEEMKKEQARLSKEIIDATKKDISRLSINILNGYEMKSVECRKLLSEETNTAQIVRTDTGEVVDERPMTEEELQGSFI